MIAPTSSPESAPDARPAQIADWPATWVRALLPSAILACLEQAPLHGYAIGQALGHRGFGVPKGGSLYPALARLEESAMVRTQWVPGPSGPARRLYSLTARGRAQLDEDRRRLAALSASLSSDAHPTTASGAAEENQVVQR